MESVEILPALDLFGFYFFQCLISFLWQSSLVLGPMLIILWLFRGCSPAIRNSIVMTGFMTLPVILAYSWFWEMPPTPSHLLPVMPDYNASKKIIPAEGSGNNIRERFRFSERNSGEALQSVTSGVRQARNEMFPVPGRDSSSVRSSGILAYPWALALALYILIQSYLILKYLMEWGIVRWWIWRARTIEEIPVCRVFWRAAFFLEVGTSRFEIMECPSISMPVTVGTVHPRIILPPGFFERCFPEDFRAVAYHELAHVHRRDPLVLTFISLLRTALFFHPLVQLAAWEFTLIAEQTSDEAAIEESGVSPVSYARSLTRIVELLAPQALKPSLALGIFRQRSLFFHRLELILSDSSRKYRQFRSFFKTAAVAGFALFLSVSISLPLVARDTGSVVTSAIRGSIVPPVISLAPPFTACAIPVHHIRIDGDIDDWPNEMLQYPIWNRLSRSGAPGDTAAVHGGNTEECPWMMIGYSPDDGFLYVAVTVPDKRVVKVSDPEWAAPERTDACEVYVDGMHISRTAGESMRTCGAWDLPAQQYVMCPGGGAYDRSAWLRDAPYTPALFRGNIRMTGSTCVSKRHGKVTTYEWAVRVYTRFPEQPLRLMPGGVIGFDVVVRDCDHIPGDSSWSAWGPPRLDKAYDTSLLGNLVLVERYEDLGFVSGAVTRCGKPCAGCKLHVYRENAWIGEYTADRTGNFQLMLPPGNYTVQPGETNKEKRFFLDTFTVSSGAMVKSRLNIAMNGFARLRYETPDFHRMTWNRPN